MPKSYWIGLCVILLITGLIYLYPALPWIGFGITSREINRKHIRENYEQLYQDSISGEAYYSYPSESTHPCCMAIRINNYDGTPTALEYLNVDYCKMKKDKMFLPKDGENMYIYKPRNTYTLEIKTQDTTVRMELPICL